MVELLTIREYGLPLLSVNDKLPLHHLLDINKFTKSTGTLTGI